MDREWRSAWELESVCSPDMAGGGITGDPIGAVTISAMTETGITPTTLLITTTSVTTIHSAPTRDSPPERFLTPANLCTEADCHAKVDSPTRVDCLILSALAFRARADFPLAHSQGFTPAQSVEAGVSVQALTVWEVSIRVEQLASRLEEASTAEVGTAKHEARPASNY
jgi:hypothetical protein